MSTYDVIQKERNDLKSVYDLVAVCYDYLLDKIDDQIKFISEYLECSVSHKKNNPNQKRLLRFSDDVKQLLSLNKYWNDRVLHKIFSLVFTMENSLKPFGEEAYNEAAIAFFLLLGIDLYAEYQPNHTENAPLNRCCQKDLYIYCRQRTSILSTAAKKAEFRDQIPVTDIRSSFTSLCILEKTDLKQGMTPPKMVTLFISKEDFKRSTVAFDQKLVLAVTPFCREEICQFSHVQGCGFRIEYHENYMQFASKRALDLLELAIKHRANIVLFPEYVCSPEVQEEIRKYLRETYLKTPHKLKDLLLVIAGSGWTKDDNNVAAVYSYSGKLLGKRYKSEPFDNYIKDPKTGITERWIESLSTPGKESIIVEIPKIGSVMIAICRDISNWSYDEKIARAFRTDFLMVPAWSTSLHHGFENQLESITEANINTCSVVCNCCAVQPELTAEKGLVVTPYKKGTIIKGKTRAIRLRSGCELGCQHCSGCIFCLTFGFRIQDVENGRILRSQRNYKA